MTQKQHRVMIGAVLLYGVLTLEQFQKFFDGQIGFPDDPAQCAFFERLMIRYADAPERIVTAKNDVTAALPADV